MNAPRRSHYNAAMRVVRYLKNQPGLGILLAAGKLTKLECFVDSDWGTCLDTHRSVTGYLVYNWLIGEAYRIISMLEIEETFNCFEVLSRGKV